MSLKKKSGKPQIKIMAMLITLLLVFSDGCAANPDIPMSEDSFPEVPTAEDSSFDMSTTEGSDTAFYYTVEFLLSGTLRGARYAFTVNGADNLPPVQVRRGDTIALFDEWETPVPSGEDFLFAAWVYYDDHRVAHEITSETVFDETLFGEKTEIEIIAEPIFLWS